jgi:hypothetical protein
MTAIVGPPTYPAPMHAIFFENIVEFFSVRLHRQIRRCPSIPNFGANWLVARKGQAPALRLRLNLEFRMFNKIMEFASDVEVGGGGCIFSGYSACVLYTHSKPMKNIDLSNYTFPDLLFRPNDICQLYIYPRQF